jgi:Ion transport protein
LIGLAAYGIKNYFTSSKFHIPESFILLFSLADVFISSTLLWK